MSLFFPSILMFFVMLGSSDSENDYSPCSDLTKYFSGLYIECDGVASSQIRQLFHRDNIPDRDFHGLHLSVIDDVISDLIGDKTFSNLHLSCPSRDFHLKVDADAFYSTRKQTERVSIINCDLSQSDLAFLTGFDRLNSLIIQSSHLGRSLKTLPELKGLSSLEISHSTGLREGFSADDQINNLVQGLKDLNLEDDDLDDDSLNRILDWILPVSAETLKSLKIGSNKLNRIPEMAGSFQLDHLDLSGNLWMKLDSAGSPSFSSPIQTLDLSRSGVDQIDPNTFQGDFSQTVIRLEQNNLTRFEENVFLPLLQQMNQSTGYIDLNENHFDCSSDACHLHWLLVENRNMLTNVRNATCSNGTKFEDLTEFQNCDDVDDEDARPVASSSSVKKPSRLHEGLLKPLRGLSGLLNLFLSLNE